MISTPHPIEAEELMAFLDGELPADRAAAVGEHVEGCAECRKMAEDLRAVSRRLAEWEVEACRLRAVEGKVRRRWWPGRAVWVGGLAATAVGVAFLIAPARRKTQYSRVEPAALGQLPRSRLLESRPQGQQGQGGNTYFSASPTLTDQTVMEERRPGVKLMIARTAQLALVTSDFSHSRERLEAVLKSHHGYIGEIIVSAPTGIGRTLEAALKVPSAELEGSLAELKKLGRVESESQTGEEVTQQYVDLEARLNNARNAEQRLTAVLRQQAGKMDDVLAVEKEITRVRGEIEQMEAQRKNLSGRVEFATIHIKVAEEYKAQLRGPESVGTRLANAAVAGYRNVTGGLLGMAEFALEYGLSFALIAVVLFWPARRMWKRFRA